MTKSITIKWSNFSISSSEFIQAEKEEALTQLMHEYFSKNSVPNQDFIVELANNYPYLLINSIRVNRAFLKPTHYSSLHVLKHHANEYCRNHYSFFSKLVEYEASFFDLFCKSSSETNKLDISEIFCWISLWFEKKRADLFKTQHAHIFSYDINEFIEIINFYLSYYLFENKNIIATTDFIKKTNLETWIHVLEEAKSIELSENTVWKTLDKANEYLYYLKGTVEIYSFDLNLELTIKDGNGVLKYIDKNKLKRWYIESEKLKEWYNYNRNLATLNVEHKLMNDPEFTIDGTGSDYVMNYEAAIKEIISQKIADDFHISESSLGGIPSNQIIKVLRGFVSDAWGRYVAPMDGLNYMNPQNWLQNVYINILNHSKYGISTLPTRLIKNEEFLEIIRNNEITNKNSERLIKLVSLDINNTTFFDKFNPHVNLIGKPFIKINNHYMAINGVLGETSLQVNFLINTMQSNKKYHQQVESKEVEEMEKSVRDLLKDADIVNSICSIDYYKENMRIGNFDIVAYENGVLLLIELKRSKMRVHLSDAYDEYQNSLAKASKQLDKACNYLSENFDLCKESYFKDLNIAESEYSKIKIYPLIVSTTFENDHVLIKDKHLKISLFEFQHLLYNGIEMINSNKLESLIYQINSNMFWKAFEENIKFPNLDQTITFKI
jgi:hypothetical protein